MKLTDRRLYQARSLEDFLFRLDFNDADNTRQNDNMRAFVGQVFVTPDKSKIWGVDISGRWDGNVNFAPTVHAGAKFVIGKAIDGTVPTACFQENNQRAIKAGLMNGAYAWLYRDRNVSCRSQAQAYYNIIRDAKLKLPPVIDFEWTRYAGQQADPDYTDLDRWVTEFIRISGTKPILYSAAGYMNKFGRMPSTIRLKFAGFWWASYGGLSLPMGFTDWDMHQFSANGDAQLLCPGDLGKRELDLNYMTEAFYEQLGGATEPPEPGETMTQWYRVNTTGLNIRNEPRAGATDIGDLYMNDRIETEGAPTNGWGHVVRMWRVGAAAPVAMDGWCSLAYCVAIAPPVVTPPPPAEVAPAELTLRLSDGSVWRAGTWTKVG